MNTKILGALIGIAMLSLPTIAQAQLNPTQRQAQLQLIAKKYGNMPFKDLGKAWPASVNAANLNAKTDPWKPMTSQAMAASTGERGPFQTSISVDYNKDGVADRAYIAHNSKQSAVVVELGGGKGTVIAYKSDGTMKSGQELVAGGKNRILLQFPEVNVLVLAYEGGKPQVYFIGD